EAVTGVLKDPELLSKVFNSALIQQVLLSRSANYFLANPSQAKALIEKNQILSNIAKNENLKTVLLNNQMTKQFALTVFQ
ncbi:MAG: hypothetical protein II726_02020, partial [Elusimicrobiaceae bacterium]|nr:hypothetical protein [Elusimicrobiaceae bacterium]